MNSSTKRELAGKAIEKGAELATAALPLPGVVGAGIRFAAKKGGERVAGTQLSSAPAPPSKVQVISSGERPVILVPPTEKAPFLQAGRDRIRVVEKKGVRIITVDRARAITGAEAVGLAALGALIIGAYAADKEAKALAKQESSQWGWVADLNPANWKLP
jgi:hypothetical protein